jgi:predicted XRE-type DNA-binding protein
MTDEPLELIHGSGNVYRDFGRPDADVRQLKAMLAVEIMKALDDKGITVRKAHALTGIAAADFSRIRNAELSRFTIDRLTGITNKLGSRVQFTVRVERKPAQELATT